MTRAEGPPGAPLDNCAVCAAFHDYREDGRVKSGLSVDMLAGHCRAGQPVTLRFFANQKPSNWPEDHLELVHEKYMHLIGVREDLTGFFHIHPVQTGPGLWAVNYTFPRAGRYKIWTDVRWKGVDYTVGHPLFVVSGDAGSVGEKHEPRESVTVGGYRVTLDHAGPLTSGRTNQFQFSIVDAAGQPARIENFLGMPMHLVMVRDDLSVYLHVHPGPASGSDPKIHFSTALPTGGIYKLFAQFRPADAKLPTDQTLVAELYVNVASGVPATAAVENARP
jgi:hypothetical protein